MDKEKYPYKTSELFKEVQFIFDTIKGDNPYFYNIWNLMSENTYNTLNLMFVIMTAIYCHHFFQPNPNTVKPVLRGHLWDEENVAL